MQVRTAFLLALSKMLEAAMRAVPETDAEADLRLRCISGVLWCATSELPRTGMLPVDAARTAVRRIRCKSTCL